MLRIQIIIDKRQIFFVRLVLGDHRLMLHTSKVDPKPTDKHTHQTTFRSKSSIYFSKVKICVLINITGQLNSNSKCIENLNSITYLLTH